MEGRWVARSSAIAICSMARRSRRAFAWAIGLAWLALLAGCDASPPAVALVVRGGRDRGRDTAPEMNGLVSDCSRQPVAR